MAPAKHVLVLNADKTKVTKLEHCDICNKYFSDFREHLSSIHNIKRIIVEDPNSFKCWECNKTFKSEHSRKSHYRDVHIPQERPFVQTKQSKKPKQKTTAQQRNEFNIRFPNRPAQHHLKGLQQRINAKQVFATQLRTNPTKAERYLLQFLKPLGFIDQAIVLGWIPDFLHPKYKIIIEADGEYHDEKDQIEYDNFRDSRLRANGYAVIRFKNKAILNETESVLQRIQQVLNLAQKYGARYIASEHGFSNVQP